MTNNNAHQLPALIKVSSFMQPQRFSLAWARSLGSAACPVLSEEGERSEVFAPVTTEGQRTHHVVCLSGTKTEGTKTFCPYGGAAVAAVGRAKQSAPEFRGLTIAQTFPMENKQQRTQIFRSQQLKNNRINQQTPKHEVHARVNSQVDCTQGCTRVPAGLRFNELLSSGGGSEGKT